MRSGTQLITPHSITQQLENKIFPPLLSKAGVETVFFFFMLTNELHDKFRGVNSLQAKEDLSITG